MVIGLFVLLQKVIELILGLHFERTAGMFFYRILVLLEGYAIAVITREW